MHPSKHVTLHGVVQICHLPFTNFSLSCVPRSGDLKINRLRWLPARSETPAEDVQKLADGDSMLA